MDKFKAPIILLTLLIYLDPAFNDFSCQITQALDGWRVGLVNSDRKEVDDAICHSASLGHEEGLLETYHLGECSGFETPAEVYEGWKKKYTKR